MPAATSDASLSMRVREEGDAAAYTELYDRHVDAARAAAYRIAPKLDSDDVVSESFTRVLQALRNGAGPTDAFRPYLYQVIRSVCNDFWRTFELSVDELADGEVFSVQEDLLDVVGDRQELSQALAIIPTQWREVLWYTEVEGMPPRAVAPLLGLSANNVSQIRSRARARMRNLLSLQTEQVTETRDLLLGRKLAAIILGGTAPLIFPTLFEQATISAAVASVTLPRAADVTASSVGEGASHKALLAVVSAATAAVTTALVIYLLSSASPLGVVELVPPETVTALVELDEEPEENPEAEQTEPPTAPPRVEPETSDPVTEPPPRTDSDTTEPERSDTPPQPEEWVTIEPEEPAIRGPSDPSVTIQSAAVDSSV